MEENIPGGWKNSGKAVIRKRGNKLLDYNGCMLGPACGSSAAALARWEGTVCSIFAAGAPGAAVFAAFLSKPEILAVGSRVDHI